MPIEWVNEIFRCFQSSYGFQWSSRHSTTEAWNRTKQDWARLLLGMTYEEVVKGLNNLPPGNPPDAASFKQLGQKPKLNERTHHGAYKEFKPDREFKKASLATHREHYEKCMAILGKKPQPLPEGVTPEQEEQPSLGMRPR